VKLLLVDDVEAVLLGQPRGERVKTSASVELRRARQGGARGKVGPVDEIFRYVLDGVLKVELVPMAIWPEGGPVAKLDRIDIITERKPFRVLRQG
jgi:hypothetical protein